MPENVPLSQATAFFEMADGFAFFRAWLLATIVMMGTPEMWTGAQPDRKAVSKVCIQQTQVFWGKTWPRCLVRVGQGLYLANRDGQNHSLPKISSHGSGRCRFRAQGQEIRKGIFSA
jgi:hypothetical protein